MTDEEAQAWVAAGFQQLVGDLYRARSFYQQTQIATSLLRALERAGLVSLPSDMPRSAMLTNQAAAWAVDQPDEEPEEATLREEAPVKARIELPTQAKPGVETPGAGLETILAHLAKQSVAYVEQLKLDHDLALPELDVAVAWMLTEVTKRGLEAQSNQVANAVRAAFAERGAE
jgi:hypothetical protein